MVTGTFVGVLLPGSLRFTLNVVLLLLLLDFLHLLFALLVDLLLSAVLHLVEIV